MTFKVYGPFECFRETLRRCQDPKGGLMQCFLMDLDSKSSKDSDRLLGALDFSAFYVQEKPVEE